MDLQYAILFYSKHSIKSIELKEYFIKNDVNFEYVNVDKKRIRNMLMEDNMYNIEEIPSILLIYKNNEYNCLYGNQLDKWTRELIQNIEYIKKKQQEEYENEIREYQKQQIIKNVEQAGQRNGIERKTNEAPPSRLMASPGEYKMENDTKMLIDLSSSEVPKQEHNVSGKINSDKPLNPKEAIQKMQEEREKHDKSMETQRMENDIYNEHPTHNNLPNKEQQTFI